MNKKIMSVVVIVMTMITVCIMIYSSKYSNEQLNYLSLKNHKVINNAVKNEDSNKKDVKSKVPNGTINSGNTVKNNTTSYENTEKKDDDNSVVNNVSSAAQNANENTHVNIEENSVGDTKNNDVDSENNKPIFKIAKDKIKDKLSFADKAKILIISKSLSPTDFSKIQEDLNSKDDKKGVVSAMNLLKVRLDDNDYSKLKSIAAKFINLDALNY